ncbi:RNA methyltransferase [Natroniella acetigena]|uniref:RNA methyltransferase n=1 Tax=Natroniella acetigena TaxID=52004 RepID=UPI00200A2EA9|nr:RNA methyltransferase [Natroniella acetigena]MCK8827115.1 RNA methyltransferase [Natroniella acetigena]
MEQQVYLALLHNPVYNKNMEVITTTVTNLDLHDIARASRTYNIGQYYIVNHLDSQQDLVNRMKDYWAGDFGAEYNPDRKEAFSVLEIKAELKDVIADITAREGKEPTLVTTDARTYSNTISYRKLRQEIAKGEEVYLILLGTGWGLTKETMKSADYILEPIYGPGDYNHLSVRSAAAIILDRLLGEVWW